tara:strand:+ start:341 stop:487 length:147 start_codon:yes stop_codon:yes gene_type:complete
MSDLIKWSVLSRKLSGSEQSVRPKKVPAKYKSKVDSLLQLVNDWEKKL